MATLNIIVGSVYGNAENVAEEVQSYCEDQGIDAEVFKDPDVSDFTDPKALLVITSTTGAGAGARFAPGDRVTLITSP